MLMMGRVTRNWLLTRSLTKNLKLETKNYALLLFAVFLLIALPAIASAFQVTTNGSSVQPSWSLDGKRLVYQSATNGITNIWTINIDGTAPKQITNMPGILYGINRAAWGPVYQPNNNQIYYMDNSISGADYHWIVKTSADGSTGRNPVLMVPGGNTFSAPKFSPDGSKFCYVQYNPYSTIKYSIKIANADGTNSQSILGDNNINYAWTHSVSWGSGINSDKLLYTKKVNGVVSFYVVKTNGTGETKITDSSIASGYDVDWSPDGTKIIFTGTDSQIYTMNIDGSNTQQITNDADENSQGEFSPNGLQIAYVSKRNGASDIYIVDLYTHAAGTVLFTDDFNDNYIDPTKWEYGGYSVTETAGIMQLDNAAIDNWGWIKSKWIDINPDKPLTITRRTKLHFSNNYHRSALYIYLENAPNFTFGITYDIYSYTGGTECAQYGFFIIRNATPAINNCGGSNNISVPVTPVWDTWFDEKLSYNPATGLLEYFINNVKQTELNVGVLPSLSAYRISLYSNADGWFTGHYQYFDDIVVSQENANLVKYMLSLTKTSHDSGGIATVGAEPSITCETGCTTAGASYNIGTSVTVTATPASGYAFTGWSVSAGFAGTCTGTTNPCAVTMDTSKTVTADFQLITSGSWTPIGPEGGMIEGVVLSPNYAMDQTLFAITQNGGVFKSTNGGMNWTAINTGLNNVGLGSLAISPNYSADQTLFAGTGYSGISKSTNGGATWTIIYKGLYVGAIAVSPTFAADQTIFAGTHNGGVIKSTNGGTTWTSVNTGLSNLAVRSVMISPNFSIDQTVFAGTNGGGIFKSTNGGVSWTVVNTGLSSLAVSILSTSPNFASDQTVFAGTFSGGVFKSTNGGASWTAANTGINVLNIRSIAISPNYVTDQTIFVGTAGGGLFKSTNRGSTWAAANSGLATVYVYSLAISPNYATDQTLFSGTYGIGMGVFKSTNGGATWAPINTGLRGFDVPSIAVSPNYSADQTVFASTDGAGIYKSVNRGTTWATINMGLGHTNVYSLAVSPNYATDQTLFAGTWGGVFKSTNGGTTWSAVNTGLSNLNVFLHSLVISPDYATDQTIFTGTYNGGVFRSTNGGASWIAVKTGLSNLNVGSLAISPNYATDQTIFIGTSGLYRTGSGVFKSINGGSAWTSVNTGLSNLNVVSIVVSPNYATDQTLFAATDGSGVFKSTNGGGNWTAVNTGLSDLNAISLAVSPKYAKDQTLFAGTFDGVVYKSNNGGASWIAVSTGFHKFQSQYLSVSPAYPCDGTLFVGTSASSVLKYTDTEAMTTCSPPPTITFINPSSTIAGTFDLTINGSNFDAGTVDQVYTPTGVFMGQGTIKSRTSTRIVVTEYMSGTGPGNYTVKVKNSNGQESNGVTLTITSCSYTAGQGTSGLQLTAFQAAYSSAGGRSVLGCSQGVVRSALASGTIGSTATGLVQDFDKGHIHLMTGSTIAYVTFGTIDTLYVDMGGTASQLGFPTSDPFITVDGATRQDFEGGYMYTTLDGITSTVVTAKPTLIKLNNPSDYRVFYVSNSGTKYHIPDPETFEILRFDWSAIKAMTDTEFNSYTTGSGIPVLRTGSARDGSMVWRGTKDSIKVYLIENGVLRHIPDPDALYAMGRTFDEVIELDAALFDRIPIGAAIPSATDDSFIYYVSGLGLSGIAGYDLDVNTAIGNYTFQKTDLAIPGRGMPVVFATAYNAMAQYNPKSSIDSYIMGPGWTHSYNMTATEVTKDGTNLFVRVKWGDGHEEVYKWDGTAYKGFGVHNKVTGGGGSSILTITNKTQIKYSFTLDNSKTKSYPSTDKYGNPTTLTTNVYRLSNISDRNSNTTTLNYSGNLSSITDTVGRFTSFTYTTMTDSSGTYITRLIKVTDPIGRTVEFTYDADGKLISSKDLNGGTITFAYTQVQGLSTPLVATITDPRGNPYVSNSYTDGITDTNYKKATSLTIGGSGPSSISYSGSTASVTDPLAFTTLYTHDTSNRLTKVTDPLTKNIGLNYGDTSNPLDPTGVTDKRNYQTIFTYDSNGNVLTMTDPLGKVTNLEYDSMNNLTRKTDALGRVATYTYDAKWNLKKISAPIGIINLTNNSYGHPETVTDAMGNTTLYVYDSQGNLTEIRESLGKTTKLGYDSVGRKTSETDANENITYFTYDNNNNLLTIKNALNQTSTYQYDTNGNRTAVIDENGNTTSYTYDARNRLTTVTDPEGGAISYGYDELNRLKTITDANEKVTKHEYDAIDNLTKVTDANSGTVTYTYDPNGNRLSMTDTNGKTTNYTYDFLNRLRTKAEPLGGVFEYFYDAVGNLDYMTGPRGKTDYEYDLMNRVTKITYPDYSTVSFVYDNNGNITSMTDGLGTTTYQYDVLNRLTNYTDPFGKTVAYGYDYNNNRTSITYPDSKVVQYGYDTLNRLATVKDWLSRTATYSYDSASRLTEITNPNGTVSVYAYDKANRLTALTNRKSNYDVISTYSYTLDAVGNHTSVNLTEALLPSLPNQNIPYTYDSENRLTSAGGISYGYDNNGNLTSRGSSDNFSYDYRDKLTQSFISGVTTQYKYDGVGNRLAKIDGGTTKRYVLDINSELPNVIAETDGSGNITAYYVYGLGLISKILPDGTASYYHYDSRGSTIALTDANQNMTDAYTYDPFGKVVNSTGSTPNPFKYVGRYGLMDEGNGLTYIRARYYAPELGRFITKDLLTGEDGDGQSLHRYMYAMNNPVRLVDVSGLSGEMPLWYRLTNWAEPTQQFITDMCRATVGIPEPMLRHYCAGFTIGSAITNTIRNANGPSNLRKFANDIGVQIQGVGEKINNRISKKVFIQKGKPTITVNHSLLSPRGKKVFKKVMEFGVELAFDLVSPVQVMIIDPWSMIFYGNKGTQL